MHDARRLTVTATNILKELTEYMSMLESLYPERAIMLSASKREVSTQSGTNCLGVAPSGM